mmetsp:Transcript_111210/g.358807  ORF Transcript_111210/g.358807 Transcript_111210/m.358807 type:complete len:241 (+) Transcript_111210:289-1011(+)
MHSSHNSEGIARPQVAGAAASHHTSFASDHGAVAVVASARRISQARPRGVLWVNIVGCNLKCPNSPQGDCWLWGKSSGLKLRMSDNEFGRRASHPQGPTPNRHFGTSRPRMPLMTRCPSRQLPAVAWHGVCRISTARPTNDVRHSARAGLLPSRRRQHGCCRRQAKSTWQIAAARRCTCRARQKHRHTVGRSVGDRCSHGQCGSRRRCHYDRRRRRCSRCRRRKGTDSLRDNDEDESYPR